LPENHVRKEKSKGISHTMMDLRKGKYHDVEDDEKNLVVVVFAGDAAGGRKELAGEVVGVGRRRQEERKFYFTTREIFQTRGSSTVVLLCFAQGIGTYI
jgi:hypothetical protein